MACVLGALCAVVAALALSAASGAAAASSPCGTVNFFPTATQITGSPSTGVTVGNGTLCAGSEVCNWPPVWSKALQEANVSLFGFDHTVAAGGLLKVALKEYGSAQPKLWFLPSSPLLKAGQDAGACVEAATTAAAAAAAAASRRRRLSAAALQTVTVAGSWSYSVRKAGDAGGLLVSETSRGATQPGEIDLAPEAYADDTETCLVISITLQGYTVANAPAGFPRTVALTANVCFYRHNGQATAAFDFSTCRAEAGVVSVNASAVAPLAQALTQNGSASLLGDDGEPRLLFQPVLQVFGKLVRSIDGQPEDNPPASAIINRYYVLPRDLTADDVLTLALEDESGALDEGLYEVSAKVAVITLFPNLVDLQGRAQVNQTDVDAVRGYTEYMGFLVRNGTDRANVPLLGLQSAARSPALAAIGSPQVGTALKAGDNVTFTWAFVGAGGEKCFHDGVAVTAVPCESPVTLPAKSFAVRAQHTFEVVLSDVCGNTKTANFTYSSEGVEAVSAVDYVDPAAMTDDAGNGGGAGTGAGSGLLSTRGTTAAAGAAARPTALAAAAAAAAIVAVVASAAGLGGVGGLL